MTCNQIHQHLTNYLERNCEKSEIVLIARHIESCRGCARQLTEMQQVKSLLKRTRTIEKHPCTISEMITAILEQTTHPLPRSVIPIRKTRVFHNTWYIIAMATSVIAAAVSIFWLLLSPETPTITHRPMQSDDMSIYLQEHEFHADKSVFSNGSFGSVILSKIGK
ncbi:MAG: zf-HC2 domain-containing protein [Gemmatimonadota bacterium]|nr:zf-HC2 domain-containing protein [Gemmatimonadota bacterium]